MRRLIPFLPVFFLPFFFLSLFVESYSNHPYKLVEQSYVKPFVTIKFRAQLGNQLFQAAALVATALENGAEPVVMEKSLEIEKEQLATTLNKVLFRLPRRKISKKAISTVFRQTQEAPLRPIQYSPNMRLAGYFESEGFFKKYKKEIIRLFSPSDEIMSYLKNRYKDLLNHPKTVAIHIRTFYRDYLKDGDSFYRCFPPPDIGYYIEAMRQFDKDSLFVIFSDHIPWCKKQLEGLDYDMVFIENESYYHDFYLCSLMKNMIMSNSTFSWWAAYLNPNPEKKVIVRSPWYMDANKSSEDIILKEWSVINRTRSSEVPNFEE